MLEVHPAHSAARSWRDFFIHIATITIGLLIAVSLEQSVEFFHHRHQRQQLVAQLHEESVKNREFLRRDLTMESAETWFLTAQNAADHELQHFGLVSFTTPPAPCIPGKVSSDDTLYIAPVDGVWTTARESNLVYLLPADEAHYYVRLSHNFDLQLNGRENMASACERLYALQTRFAKRSADGATETWTMTAEQAGRLAEAAAAADAAMRSLVARVKVSLAVVEFSLRENQDFAGFDAALRGIVEHADVAAPSPKEKGSPK